LKAVGRDDSIVTYKEAEPFTTKVKHMDFLNSKAVRDLKRLLRKGKGRKY